MADPRKDKLTDTDEVQVTVPLRDQIPQKLLTKLRELDYGNIVVNSWEQGNAHRGEWLERQRALNSDWDNFADAETGGAFDWSSNLHIPLSFVVLKTLHARFLQAMTDGDPVPKPKRAADVVAQPMVESLMSHTLRRWANYGQGVYGSLDRFLWEWAGPGCGILKARWDRRFQRYVDVVEVMERGPSRFVYDAFGDEHEVPTMKRKEIEKAVTKETFNGPVLEDKRPESVLVVGGGGDPQIADQVTESIMLSDSDLLSLADQKIFDADIVKEIVDGGTDEPGAGSEAAIQHDRAVNAGLAGTRDPAALPRHEILEDYRSYCVDDSGINSEIVAWVEKKSKKILRATYLHRISKNGMRPYFKSDFYLRPGQTYGIGLLEILSPLSKEMDAIHNYRVDVGYLQSMPFGFYRPTASIDPKTIPLEPGTLIPVEDPQRDVYFPNLGNRTSFGFQEEAALQTLVERLTSVNDLSTGVLTGAQGATRTATGVRGLIGEQNANLDVHLRRLNIAWEQVLRYLLSMIQDRMPPGYEFRVTAETGEFYFQRLNDAKEIAGEFDFELSANSSNSNKAVQQQNAQDILNMTLNPVLIQLGISKPGNVYEAVKNFYQSHNIRDFGRFCTKPAQGPTFQLSPMEEANRVLLGIEVPVNLEDDHQGFIEYVDALMKHDEILAQFGPQAAALLKSQAQKHAQAAAAMQHAQSQAANIGQMQNNAAQSAQQAPPGMAAGGGGSAPMEFATTPPASPASGGGF